MYMMCSHRLFMKRLRMKTTIKFAVKIRGRFVCCWKARPKTSPVKKAVKIKPGKNVNFGNNNMPNRLAKAALPAVTSGENSRAVNAMMIKVNEILVSNSWMVSKLPKTTCIATNIPSSGSRLAVSDGVMMKAP